MVFDRVFVKFSRYWLCMPAIFVTTEEIKKPISGIQAKHNKLTEGDTIYKENLIYKETL